MSINERNEIIELFKKNTEAYLGINDLQEAITSISYLFWNAKYVMKNNFANITTTKEINVLLQQGTKEQQDFIWNICNSCRSIIVESNLINIINYLDKLSEEQLVDVICEDYELYSRFTSSTPKTINELVYKILETENGNNVLDICSYTGNFLSYYAKKQKDYSYTGIEINYNSSTLAQERLSALKVKSKIITSNIFDYKSDKKYDKIFCNQPFNIKIEQNDLDKINNLNRELNIEFTKRITSDWTFVSNVINNLAEKGKAVVLMFNGGLFKQPDTELRKELIEKGFVESVISLPRKLFSNTAIETTLLVLSRNNNKIKFINANKLFEVGKPNNQLKVDDIFKEYLSDKETDITKIVEKSETQKSNYSLLSNNYMNAEIIEIKNPKQLKDVTNELFRGYQVSTSEISQYSENKNNIDPYKIINITNITNGEIDKDLTSIYPENDKMDRYLLKDQDLLVTLKGTTTKFAVASVKNDERYIPSGNFTILRLNTKIINPYYLKMFFECNKGTAILNSIRSGGVLPSINISLFKEINVPVPSMNEQNEIVNRYLAKNDEIKIMKNKLLSLEQNLLDMTNEEF